MIVKDFEGQNMSEILRKIKVEFGKNAVILSTQKVKNNGNEGYFVIRAAVPEDKRVNGAQIEGPSIHDTSNVLGEIQRVELKLDELKKNLPAKSEMSHIGYDIKDLKLLTLKLLSQKDKKKLNKDIDDDLLPIIEHLVLMNLDQKYIDELIQYLSALPDDNVSSQADRYKSHAVRWLLKRIKISPAINPSQSEISTHLFIGPSGSGKTTSIAKLAALLKKSSSNSVAIASFNDIQLGASDNLHLYAKILDIPFFDLTSSSKLDELASSSSDVFLIDTPGYSINNEEGIEKICDLKEKVSRITKTHLVLSLTEKQSYLDNAIRFYSQAGINHLLFSKLDETWTVGEVFNLAQRWSIPLSYFSTSQNIPDGIQQASREFVIERILRI